MKPIHELIAELGLQQQITLEDMPNIDLYMDQVIQLFENTYGHVKRNENEKLLTKTMINNYAKDKLFIPIKNKKYSKEHLILISLIFQLKGGLSIADIKQSLSRLNQGLQTEELELEPFYRSYISLAMKNVAGFEEEVARHVTDVLEESKNFEGESADYLQQLLLITSLVQISNHYRRLAEKLVDEFNQE